VIRRGLALLTLAACSPAPRPTPEVMPEVAAEFGEIHNEWDRARLFALMTPEAQAESNPPGYFAWLHHQLGDCGAPTFLWPTSKRGARFEYPCERGALQAEFRLDEAGQILHMQASAAGIPTPPALHDAAVVVLASLPWSPETERPFKHNLNEPQTIRMGECELVKPWVTAEFGALFHVLCKNDNPAILALGVHKNGTIKSAKLTPAYKIYKGPPVGPAPQSP
jgi:hypothetical protein